MSGSSAVLEDLVIENLHSHKTGMFGYRVGSHDLPQLLWWSCKFYGSPVIAVA